MPGGSPASPLAVSTMAAKQELVDKSLRKHSQMKESGKWEADLLQHTDEDLTWEQLTSLDVCG